MNFRHALIALSLTFAPLAAQTQLVRGEVDRIQNTQNLFQLKCTTVRLTSATLDLNALHNATQQQPLMLAMQVIDTFGNGTSLEVVAATVLPRMHDMGNLRFGRAVSWEVFAPCGSLIWTFVQGGSLTGYTSFGSLGTWILGPNPVPFFNGVSTQGSLRRDITMPTIPSLVGAVFASQSIVQTNGTFLMTNADCKDVRAN